MGARDDRTDQHQSVIHHTRIILANSSRPITVTISANTLYLASISIDWDINFQVFQQLEIENSLSLISGPGALLLLGILLSTIYYICCMNKNEDSGTLRGIPWNPQAFDHA
jgi:predicted membrane protein